MGPVQRASQEAASARSRPERRRSDELREARQLRRIGIVLVSVGGGATVLGTLSLVAGMTTRFEGSIAGSEKVVGAGLLAVGGLSLAIGIPSLVQGVSATRASTMPLVQVGPTSASLVWSF